MLPDELREDFEPIFNPDSAEQDTWILVKAADKLCAYFKCKEEILAGNPEFIQAKKQLKSTLEKMKLPEVDYFLNTFAPSLSLTLDELA